MPCWSHEAHAATLSNTWFLCERCLEARRFAQDAAAALEHESQASTSNGAIAESLPKAGSELADAGAVPSPQSPPPGAGPERDPAGVLTFTSSSPEAPAVIYATPPPGGARFEVYTRLQVPDYLSDVDPGDQA